MSLAEFQASLGGLIRVPVGRDPFRPGALSGREHKCLTALAQSAGFQFTVKVQRSWCSGRAGKAAYLTLSVLSEDTRGALLDEWVESGGGTLSFVGAESAAFLAFIAARLPERSHELSVCHFEMAALRVAEGAARFEPPDLSGLGSPMCRLRRGRYAGIARFHGDPNRLLKAVVEREGIPPPSLHESALIFGPGLDRLCRTASCDEIGLFERLATPVMAELLFRECGRELVDEWMLAGVIEYDE